MCFSFGILSFVSFRILVTSNGKLFFLQFSAYVMIEIFYLKKNVSFSRYLDCFVFGESTIQNL